MPGPFFGQSHKRLEDARLLRGEASFIEDVRLVGMRHVVFVRSIHAHARFRADATTALAAPAVSGVFTATDFDSGHGVPEVPTVVGHEALRPCRQPALARTKVRYVGEPIAAVVAADRYAAEDAAAAVTVEYEPLVAVPDARAALAAGAAVLHEPLGDNIAADFTVRVGDAEAAFRSAEVITRGRYYVHRHTGMSLETRGVAARYDAGTGHLTMWTTTQWPHVVRDVLRDLLGFAEHKIRVVVPDMGGAFGVKQEVYRRSWCSPCLPRVFARRSDGSRRGTSTSWARRTRASSGTTSSWRPGATGRSSPCAPSCSPTWARTRGAWACSARRSPRRSCPARIDSRTTRAACGLRSPPRRRRAPIAARGSPRLSSPWSARWIISRGSSGWTLPSCDARTSSVPMSSRGSSKPRRPRCRWPTTGEATARHSTGPSSSRGTKSAAASRPSSARRARTVGCSASGWRRT